MSKPIIMQHPDAKEPVTVHPSQVEHMIYNGWFVADEPATTAAPEQQTEDS